MSGGRPESKYRQRQAAVLLHRRPVAVLAATPSWSPLPACDLQRGVAGGSVDRTDMLCREGSHSQTRETQIFPHKYEGTLLVVVQKNIFSFFI